MASYYEGLSGDSSSSDDESNSSEDRESCSSSFDSNAKHILRQREDIYANDDADERTSPTAKIAAASAAVSTTANNKTTTTIISTTTTTTTTTRCILHLDVDCFYGQCEHLDRGIPVDRPLAIGQKHIIVTSNYAARAYGVGKLETRDKALAKCPGLLIVEGSDLEQYRKHAWKIYTSFRRACKNECSDVAVSKGSGMDEMLADLSVAVEASLAKDADNHNISSTDTAASIAMAMAISESNVYIYGEQGTSETTVLTEDQSGAAAVVVRTAAALHETSKYDSETVNVKRRLHRAAVTAIRIRRRVLEETGFTTTIGISVNPLLAKLAGGLKKPHTVNVLYPWCAPPLLASMPLRKIPGIGSRTIKALNPCLLARHGQRPSSSSSSSSSAFWSCRDILQTPASEVTACLETVQATKKSAAEQSHLIFKNCRGLDDSSVVDDQGGLPKTVSVENSFRRGTILTQRAVNNAVEDFYERLPRLVKERARWSHVPVKAYPTTIRLTVRSVVKSGSSSSSSQLANLHRTSKRSVVTRSKQMAVDGRAFMALEDVKDKSNFLRRIVAPLLRTLLPSAEQINVTRINIAVTNFQDLTLTPTPQAVVRQSNYRSTQPAASLDSSPNIMGVPKEATATTATTATIYASDRKSFSPAKGLPRASKLRQTDSEPLVVDPAVLAELPADIAAEVRRAYPQINESSTKRKRIDQFFAPK
jgi:nucleotidyltransferase/DNA polymerase involved in DNA repair